MLRRPTGRDKHDVEPHVETRKLRVFGEKYLGRPGNAPALTHEQRLRRPRQRAAGFYFYEDEEVGVADDEVDFAAGGLHAAGNNRKTL